MIALFFILYTIKNEVAFDDFYGSRSMGQLLSFGVNIIGLFSAVFIFYTNSFLLKRRQNELGLYSVLDMEKKHIIKVLLFENLFSGVFSLVEGLLSGALFSKLMFALLLNILSLDTSIKLALTMQPILVTVFVFLSIFILIGMNHILKIKRSKPIDLLKGEQKGEKEPKANWLLGLAGVIAVGMGYFIALTIKKPLEAFFTFFIAAFLVIVGSYLLFTSGSILIIKLLQKNKNFYYKKNNFIALSNMSYRMKQNAVGLANIAILSSAVLLILSSTTSLYVGLEDVLDKAYPKDMVTNYIYTGHDPEEIKTVIEDHAENNQVEIKAPLSYYQLFFAVNLDENSFEEATWTSTTHYINIMSLEDYNRMFNSGLALNEKEVLVSGDIEDYDQITIYGEKYAVKEKLEVIDIASNNNLDSIDIVVASFEEMERLERLINDDREDRRSYSYSINCEYHFDLDGKLEDKLTFGSTLRDQLNESIERVAVVQDKYTARDDTLAIYGSLFFIGILLGSVFMVATVLIIYYKQITEGYEDKKRFRILQDVGLSKGEVSETIRSQVLFVFFLPLLTAITHIFVAFPLVNKLLLSMNLDNTKLFLISTGIVIIVFGLIYTVVYRWTARIYYRIVN